ncbi:MAG TPA: nicotinamide riboside transporter PnuC [Bacteroidales bacterium]|nr:nicotinamide riboside transporter PnuC [Bacteroidales bacterium]HPI68448.1 nicotinamide riboside transporter PnuC [Bacteroidales bacterium]HPR73800.1 nicotinamide riboside transporter PnuC [Bacteroidales bacterium]
MHITNWILDNYIEIFGALTGIIYIFLEIRQNVWLWPVGIITSSVYIWVFLNGKLYADMSLQAYYLFISILGWYWWMRGSVKKEAVPDNFLQEENTDPGGASQNLRVTRLNLKMGIILLVITFVLWFMLWAVLSSFTDSPVPVWDSSVTSLSIVATWMLARKIYEHWYLWVLVNLSAAALFFSRNLYPTVILYIVYCIMSFAGLIEWRKSLPGKHGVNFSPVDKDSPVFTEK